MIYIKRRKKNKNLVKIKLKLNICVQKRRECSSFVGEFFFYYYLSSNQRRANSKVADELGGEAENEEPEVFGRLGLGDQQAPQKRRYDQIRAPANVAKHLEMLFGCWHAVKLLVEQILFRTDQVVLDVRLPMNSARVYVECLEIFVIILDLNGFQQRKIRNL